MEINCAKYPLICAVIPFGVGIILAKFILPFTIALFFSILLFILYLIFYKSNKSIFILFLLLVCTGALRYQQVDEILPVNYLSRFSADSVHGVSGTIVKSQFAADDRNQYILDCDSVWLQDEKKSVQGRILLKTKKLRQRYFYGMRLIIRGRIELPPTERNPGQFDYRQYLAQNDISHLMLINSSDSIEILTTNDGNNFRSYLTEPVKTYCQKIFYNHLQQSSAAIMNALILGEKQNLDRTTIENFQQVGVVHVLAISGLHVGYVVLFVFTTLSFLRLSQKYRILVLAAILLIYIVLVNFKPPVMRASLMVLLYLWGKLIERKISTGNLIAASAFLILLYEPRELLNPGFQFSFSAVISIIYGYKRLNELIPLGSRLKNNKYLINIVWNPLLVSVSAVMGTLPLTLYYYGTLPVIAILANIVVIPLIGIIVLLGFFLLIISPISSGLADGIGLLIHFTYQVLDTITLIFSRIPFATLDLPIPDLILTLLIATGIALFFFLKPIELVRIMPYYVGVLILYLFIKLIPSAPYLEITFLDVGQGDAILLQFPNKKTMLIDAGDASGSWDNGKVAVIPYLKQRGILRINYLVGSHPHDDHIGGFHSVIDRLSVDTVVFSPYDYPSKNYAAFLRKCNAKQISIRRVLKGDQLFPDSTARVYILHPDSDHVVHNNSSGGECNNSSLVMKIQYGKNGVLLTGDLEMEAEPAMFPYKEFLECEIIKIAHHGSKTSSSQTLLNFVQPLVAVIPVAKKNKFKHPSPVTVERLKKQAVQTYFTSRDGAIIFKLGPEKIRKINWRD